ncbi:MAG TPA: hypothetical protein VGQ37_06685 [Vicinamibacterales bacterium]|jgi:hypothetical protein|nr:hypothetical protein [Vicinamibacterales bacterium]
MTDKGDFPAHIRFAEDMVRSGTIVIPHFGYQLAVIGAHTLHPSAGWPVAAFWVTLAGQVATAAILTRWMVSAVSDRHPGVRLLVAALVPVALLVAQPLQPIGPGLRDQWLFGYFPPNQYHNPTTLLSKPFALAIFSFAALAVSGVAPAAGRPMRGGLGWTVLVTMAGLVKPSFLMAFLPAVFAAALVEWRRARWAAIVAAMVVPTVLLLVAQYGLRYVVQADNGVSVALAPLRVIGLYSAVDAETLVTKCLASIAFPLAVTLLFPVAAARDLRLKLAWMTFVVGALYGYLLSEAGADEAAGNFLWSGQLANFLLFAVSAEFLLRQRTSVPDTAHFAVSATARTAACFAILAWHAVSGVQHLQRSWLA